MSTSTVKLYYSGGTYGNWELNPGRLLKLDSIATYLASKTALTTSAFQYVKNDLEIKIKVDLSQLMANPKAVETFKYCSIQNAGEQIHYYFIKKPNWKSLSCVEFELVLDVLNTFVEGVDYSFKDSTNIIREHKPRFKRGRVTATFTSDGELDHSGTITDGTDFYWAEDRDHLDGEHFNGTLEHHDENGLVFTFDAEWDQVEFEKWLEEHPDAVITDGTNWAYYRFPKIVDLDFDWYRLIDYIPEGINPILNAGSGEGTKLEEVKVALNQTWHLLYRNVSNPDPDNLVDPVECYLIPDKWISVKTSSITAGKMNVNSLEIGKAYILNFTQSSATDIITLDDGTDLGSGQLVNTGEWGRMIIYRNANNRFAVLLITYYTSGVDAYSRAYAYESQTLTLNHLPLAYRKADLPSMPKTIAEWYGLTPYEDGSWTSGSVNVSTDDITDLDRTDPKNIKLIKLPYCPYDFEFTGGILDISSDSNWSYAAIPQDGGDCYALKLNNLDIRLQRNLDDNYAIGYFNLRVRDSVSAINSASKGDERIDGDLESKLFASEFFQPTYYYDSFSYNLNLEDLDVDAYIDDDNDLSAMPLRFECTSTINSRFMFTFTDLKFRFARSNYANVMPIIRNNEEVLYNVPYVNYIRTGFNYDVKAKNLQLASNMGSLALAGGSLLASLLLPSIPLKVAGIVGSIASFANSAKNAIVSAQSAENSIEAKLKQAENQRASVQGSDDVDLMTSYTENRLKFLEYEPTPIVKKMVDNLFFYAGYRSGRIGLPNHETRLNFDYLEANVQFESIRSIPNDCLQELANCFKSGVTYLHYNSNITGGYDFEQSHENWERFLFQ